MTVLDAVLQKSLSGSFMEGVMLCLSSGVFRGLWGGRADSVPESGVRVGKLPPSRSAQKAGVL